MQGLACPTQLSKGILGMQFAFVMVKSTLHSYVTADPTTLPSQHSVGCWTVIMRCDSSVAEWLSDVYRMDRKFVKIVKIRVRMGDAVRRELSTSKCSTWFPSALGSHPSAIRCRRT
jgi:hypothetical protein